MDDIEPILFEDKITSFRNDVDTLFQQTDPLECISIELGEDSVVLNFFMSSISDYNSLIIKLNAIASQYFDKFDHKLEGTFSEVILDDSKMYFALVTYHFE